MCGTDMLAWLFKYRTFVIVDFIEKAWARRDDPFIFSVYILVLDVLPRIV